MTSRIKVTLHRCLPNQASAARTLYLLLILALTLCLLPAAAGADTGSATVGDVTVSGKVDEAITATDVIITVTGDKFSAIAADTDVSKWFSNLPVGLTAKIKTAVAADAVSATVAVTGTPAAVSSAAMAIYIPAETFANGTSITVTSNPNAKWDIAKNGEYVMEVKYKDGEVVKFSNREAGWNDALKYDGSTVTLLADWTAQDGSFGKGLGFGYNDQAGKLVDGGNLRVPFTGRETVLNLNGYTVDRGLTKARDEGYVILVDGELLIKGKNSAGKMGKITGGYNAGNGGGIYASIENQAGVYLTDVEISGNKASGSGGGVFSDAGLILDGAHITGNTARVAGGGLCEVNEMNIFMFGDVHITGNKLTDGTAENLSYFVSPEKSHTLIFLEQGNDELAKSSKIGVSFALVEGSKFPADVTEPADNDYSACFFSDSDKYKVTDFVNESKEHIVRFLEVSPVTHNKPYVVTSAGEEVEYDTVQLALDAAKSGETVKVPVLFEHTGDLIIPEGVTLVMADKVSTDPANGGKLIIRKDGSLATAEGESVYVNLPVNIKADQVSAYFTGLEVSGVYANGGALSLTGVQAIGDGRIDVTGKGELTLNGESALGKVKLGAGRTLTLGETFTAAANAATVLLGSDYSLGRKVLTFAGTDQGKYAQYFKLGDAPDDSWYIGEDGLLTSKSQPKDNYLLLDKLALGKGKNVSAKNLLPVGFKGGVTWTSSDAKVFKIAGKGQAQVLKPLNLGTATLTATFADGASQTIPVTVLKKKSAATGLALKDKLTVKIGETKSPKATIKPAAALDKTLKWFATDKAVATVSDSGAITAVAKGKCKIYAVTAAGARKVISVTVKK